MSRSNFTSFLSSIHPFILPLLPWHCWKTADFQRPSNWSSPLKRVLSLPHRTCMVHNGVQTIWNGRCLQHVLLHLLYTRPLFDNGFKTRPAEALNLWTPVSPPSQTRRRNTGWGAIICSEHIITPTAKEKTVIILVDLGLVTPSRGSTDCSDLGGATWSLVLGEAVKMEMILKTTLCGEALGEEEMKGTVV